MLEKNPRLKNYGNFGKGGSGSASQDAKEVRVIALGAFTWM